MMDLPIIDSAQALEWIWHHPWVTQLGWVLVHFVWQGTLVAGVLAAALAVLDAGRARLRYALSVAAMLMLAALPVATWVLLPGEASTPVMDTRLSHAVASLEGALPVNASSVAERASAFSAGASWEGTVQAWMAAMLPWLVLGWLGGVSMLLLRLGGGAAYAAWIRRRGTQPLSAHWMRRADALTQRMGVRRSVQMRQSTRVAVPTLIGWLQPVVLVPAGLLTGLPPRQVEALLLHELAHIRRHDVLVGWVQAVLETLLFYHPAVWWISHQVRIEREHCCDDLVVAACRSEVSYAQALTALAERATRRTPLTLAASDGALLARIRRIVAPQPAQHERSRSLTVLCVALVVAFGVGAAGGQWGTAASSPSDVTAEPMAPVDTTERTIERMWVTSYAGPDTLERDTVIVRFAPPPDAPWPPGLDSLPVPPFPEGLPGPDSLREGRVFVWGDSGQTVVVPFDAPHAPMPPPALDALLRTVPRIDLDSLLRSAPEVDLDSLLRVGPNIDFDSLMQTVPRIDIDSLLRSAPQIDLDSLQRSLRIFRDTIDLKAFRWKMDSLRATWPKHFAWRADSLVWPPSDSLRQELRKHRLDIERWRREHRQQLRGMRQQWREQMQQWRERMQAVQPERLREQAEALRRQAERLEEQARRMEEHLRTDTTQADTTQGN